MTTLISEKKIRENVHILSLNNITLKRAEINYALGYKENAPSESIHDLIEEILLKIPDMYNLSAGYKIVPVKLGEDNGILAGGNYFNTHKIIASQLKNSEEAAIFVCTIGSKLEEWSEELIKKGDPAMGYVVDTIASLLVENTTEFLHNYLEELMQEKGCKVTNRFSPGYCGWDVKEQFKLFELLPDNFCGVSLGKSAFMTPRKSVSGLIGIGTKVKREVYPCKRCSDTMCINRFSQEKKLINKEIKK